MYRKRITIILAAVFYISAAGAQDYARHRVYINYGMGYANSMYDKIDRSFIYGNYAYNQAIEVKYAYFFAPRWGVGLGAGVSQYAAKNTLNIEGVIPHYNDPTFDPSGQRYYDLHYQTDNLVEQQRIWALEMPIQGYFQNHIANSKWDVIASLGFKGYFPFISAQSKYPQGDGTLTISGYEAFTNTWYADPPHFGKQNVPATPATAKLSYSMDVIADIGGLFRFSDKYDLYIGAFGGFGLMDVLPKASGKKGVIIPVHNNLFSLNALSASNFLSEYNNYVQENQTNWKKANEQWKQWRFGIKIGIHIAR